MLTTTKLGYDSQTGPGWCRIRAWILLPLPPRRRFSCGPTRRHSPAPDRALWLLLRDGELLVCASGEQATLPEEAADPRGDGRRDGRRCTWGRWAGSPVWPTTSGVDAPVPPGCRFVPLRGLHGQLGEAEYALAGYALQMLYWRRTSGFCPVCGHATEAAPRRLGAALPALRPCWLPAHQPRRADFGPRRAGRILLGHKPGWGARYSILAGFVEPGESLEDCVRRETQEEAGLAVTDIAYAGSQPWPFPHQLMVGFTARVRRRRPAGGRRGTGRRALVHRRGPAGTAVRRQPVAPND